MFLRSLTLRGFKSFADATTLDLEPGVTVVVGPNGSGKSNVVDAIAWVLGAQAPSAVRSQKMDDVIFAGTAARPALGRAEVSLTIDNSAGILPIEFSEVTVTRTLFRSGDSEYAVNGVPCRLLDVQELLSDAGVGRQQHVIVGQGQIDGVLNARPEDRRAVIEEAAGVLKYRKRKEKAERRLDASEASLLRVQDLLREVRRQLRPLERQAEAARRHDEIAGELATLRVHVAGREIAALRSRLTALAVSRAEAAHHESALKGELGHLDAEIVDLGAQLTASGFDDVADRLAAAERLGEQARGLAAVLAERTRSARRDRGHLLDETVIASLEADASRCRVELADVRQALDRAAPDLADVEAGELAFASARERLLGSLEAPAGVAGNALAEVRGELRSRRAAAEERATELARSHERCRALDAQLADVEADGDRHRHDCQALELLERPLVDDITRAEEHAAKVAAAAADAEQATRRAAEEASGLAARVEALQLALDNAHARAGAAHLAGHQGVLGTLLDLVRIDPGWEPAVAAALGEALAAVVVTDPAAAAQALRALRDADTDGAVIALGTTPREPDGGIVAGDAVRAHVRSGRADVDRLLDALLASARRFDDLEEAITVAAAHPMAIVVTPRGDRLARASWRVGEAASGVTAAALAEARRRLAAAERAVVPARDRAAAAEAEVVSARRAVAELTDRLEANDRRFTSSLDALTRAQAGRQAIAAERQPVLARIDDLERALHDDRQRIGELEALVPDLEAGEWAAAEARRSQEQQRAGLEARAAIIAGRRRDLDVHVAGLTERAQVLERRLAEIDGRLLADVEARAGAEQRRVAVERILTALAALSGYVAERRGRIERVHEQLAERRRLHAVRIQGVSARLDEQRAARTAAEQQLDVVRERARRADIEEAEARLRLESAVELLRRECDVEPDVAEAAPVPPLPEGIGAAARARELDRELRLLGPINPLALEEFTALQQRHAFLEEQLEDVRATRRDLARVIKAVDHEIETVFAAAYADVADHFAVLFVNLFPGGTGRLVLTQPDELLTTGIEIEARPGGKNVKKLSLLSGGERSLTALAFLFAVFRSRPSPFYVMDEVEAALDDINLHRFLGLLGEFRREAQLLVVSHQKRTMEAADCLFGVTMQPGGSSKVIAERIAVAS